MKLSDFFTKEQISALSLAFKTRIGNDSKARATDINGNEIYIKSHILNNKEVENFLFYGLMESLALRYENENVTIARTLKLAVIAFLQRQATIERGREYAISDTEGTYINPPAVSNILMEQACLESSQVR